jgi:DNA-binding NarL/FixJ family response regulator
VIIEDSSFARLRVFLADDHPIVLGGIKALINGDAGLEVVGEARDGRSALRLATELQPDIAVLDISMPGLNGVRLAEELREVCPKCKILALTVHEDRGYLRQLLEVGIAGYVLKRSAPEELIRAIKAVAAGGLYLDPAIASKAVGRNTQYANVSSSRDSDDLSEREIDVLRLTASGHSNKSVASLLMIGVKTVETYKARAMEKLGLRTRVELVRYVLSKGWLSDC